MRSVYVAIRDLRTGQADDPEAAAYHPGAGGPMLPDAWAVSRQGSTGWWTVIHPDGAHLAAYLMNTVDGQGLFIVQGPQAILDTLADARPGREVWRLAKEGNTEARRAARAHRTWIVDDDGEIEVQRTLIAIGEILPATPPTEAAPWGTITKLYRPALHTGLAGQGIDALLENEPDRGI